MAIFRKGKVFLHGKHLFTLTREIEAFEPAKASDFILPDGSAPRAGDQMPTQIAKIVKGEITEGVTQ